MIKIYKKVLYKDEIWRLVQDDISGDILKIGKDNSEEFYVNKNEIYNLVNVNVDYCSKGNYVLTGEGTGLIANISGEDITVIIKGRHHTIQKHKIKECYSKGSLLSELEVKKRERVNTNNKNNSLKKDDLVLYENNPYIIFELVDKDRIVLMNTLNSAKINVTNLTKNIVKLNKVSKYYRNIEVIETKDNKLYNVVVIATNYINIEVNGRYNTLSHNDIRGYYTTDNIDVLPKLIEDTKDTNKNKFITLRTVTWKNPKPKIKNNKPLELNQYLSRWFGVRL